MWKDVADHARMSWPTSKTRQRRDPGRDGAQAQAEVQELLDTKKTPRAHDEHEYVALKEDRRWLMRWRR